MICDRTYDSQNAFNLQKGKAKKQLEKIIGRRNQEFCDAAESGNAQKVQELITQFPDIINSTTLDNWSALHFAVSEGIYSKFIKSMFREERHCAVIN